MTIIRANGPGGPADACASVAERPPIKNGLSVDVLH